MTEPKTKDTRLKPALFAALTAWAAHSDEDVRAKALHYCHAAHIGKGKFGSVFPSFDNLSIHKFDQVLELSKRRRLSENSSKMSFPDEDNFFIGTEGRLAAEKCHWILVAW